VDASEVLFPPLDSPQQLSEYAATYYSDELEADYKLTLEGNSLVLQISENLEPTLTAAYPDVFTTPGGIILHSSLHKAYYQNPSIQSGYLNVFNISLENGRLWDRYYPVLTIPIRGGFKTRNFL
jgi:hypothetical protein